MTHPYFDSFYDSGGHLLHNCSSKDDGRLRLHLSRSWSRQRHYDRLWHRSCQNYQSIGVCQKNPTAQVHIGSLLKPVEVLNRMFSTQSSWHKNTTSIFHTRSLCRMYLLLPYIDNAYAHDMGHLFHGYVFHHCSHSTSFGMKYYLVI